MRHDFTINYYTKSCILYFSYTWKIYANKVLNMGNIYSFWKQLNKQQKEAKQRYIELFYNLHYKNLVRTVPIASDEVNRAPVSKAKAATQSLQKRTPSTLQR
ncbi:putative sucrose synthase [Helianthus anomalus]